MTRIADILRGRESQACSIVTPNELVFRGQLLSGWREYFDPSQTLPSIFQEELLHLNLCNS